MTAPFLRCYALLVSAYMHFAIKTSRSFPEKLETNGIQRILQKIWIYFITFCAKFRVQNLIRQLQSGFS
jgi:hypothetical protein